MSFFFTGAGNNGGGYYQAGWTSTPLFVDGTRYLAQDFGRSQGGASDPYESFLLQPGQRIAVFLGTSADPNGQPHNCAAANPRITVLLLDAHGELLESVDGNCPLLRLQFKGSPRFPPRPRRLRIAVLLRDASPPHAFELKLAAIVVGHGVSPIALSYRTDGSAGNSATAREPIVVAAVDPNSAWHDQYLYEDFANAGPQCLEYAASISGRWTRLPGAQCVQQPSFVAADRDMVVMPTPRGNRLMPFVGDSASGPAAAGVAALLLSARVSAGRIQTLLERTAISQRPESGWDPHYGYGLIDAEAAAAAAGVLPMTHPRAYGNEGGLQPVVFHPSSAFVLDRHLSQLANAGDCHSLSTLKRAAQTGDADAQTWLAMYAHSAGDDPMAARWAIRAASEDEPVAQSLLGSMYNRGWGVPIDPRAAQAWWLRAARAGIAAAMFNMGTTVASGRGALVNPLLAYGLMRAAKLRGMHFPPMEPAIALARTQLRPGQLAAGEKMAAGFAADPTSIPIP